ncbi:MAG: membrane protein insertase YidC [Saprospiraceae bacterium]|nr:MAG: membrane protein insertase YidC [Saprospiraceae bacterium]
MAPSPEEMEAMQKTQDSIAQVEKQKESLAIQEKEVTSEQNIIPQELPDSLRQQQLGSTFGPFAAAASGEEEEVTLSNDLFTITFTNKGGRIKEVLLKSYQKAVLNDKKKEIKLPLKLLEDEKNKFEYFLPIANLPGGGVRTSDLYFETVKKTENEIVFRANAGEGRYFEQHYKLDPGTYRINYDIQLEGLEKLIANNAEAISLYWENYLDKIEINTTFERNYSTVYFKPQEDGTDYCSCTSDDIEQLEQPLKWVSNTNQFFNSTLIAEQNFQSGKMESKVLDIENPDLKVLISDLKIPYGHSPRETFSMGFYIGPNEFDRLRDIGYELSDIVPFGWSIFGTVNRWIIRPLFNFLSSFIGNMGIVILVLTLLVKLVLYPLTYKMLYSQSKMSAMKPRLEGLKEKHKDDAQAQQMEQMKMYREFGVNPLGGCMPMVLQMPIWIALYRFFPASIEFRQAGFLWATDLSSYDVLFRLPYSLPLGFGSHVSLFTFLWAITTLIYTYYNTKHMDMTANPAMKYMQYLMPLFFLGFFNSYASGLTCYLLFSNLFNITQTIVTKNYIINHEKITAELEAYKKKPKKKKSGFQARLENALKEQQKLQAEREKDKKKPTKKNK